MAIVASNLTTSSSTTDASSYATASVSPTANRLILVAVGSAKVSAGTDNIPTLTGAGMTWVQVATITDVSGLRRVTLFRALSSSPGSGALTIDFAGQVQGRCEWSVSELSGIDTSGVNGANAIVQSAVNTVEGGSASTGLAVTLGSFASNINATYGAVRVNVNVTITPGSGFTELGQTTSDAFDEFETEWQSSNSPTVNWSWASTALFGQAIAIEIKAAPISFVSAPTLMITR